MSYAPERLFLAIALDDDARAALATRIEDLLGDTAMPGRPVSVPNWHVTLRFLGEVDPVQRDVILGFLSEHLNVPCFRVRFGAVGAFPRARRAAVLWIGLDAGAEETAEVAAICEEAAQAAGCIAEERPFHAHLTVSRIRPPVDVTRLTESGEVAGVRLEVGAVTLYRSVLGGNKPARYEVVNTVPLAD